MTPTLSNLINAQPYQGNDSILVGNGCCLPITHTSSSSISTPSSSLSLRNELCVPSLTKNLLSIQRFAFDNNCVFLLDSDEFYVKDKIIGKLLLRGPSSRVSTMFLVVPLPSYVLTPGNDSHRWFGMPGWSPFTLYSKNCSPGLFQRTCVTRN